MERVLGAAAVGDRVGQRADDVEELRHRPRPAVGEHQRERTGLGRAHVQEMDPLPVDLGDVLREGVEPPLLGPPVVARAPVLDQSRR